VEGDANTVYLIPIYTIVRDQYHIYYTQILGCLLSRTLAASYLLVIGYYLLPRSSITNSTQTDICVCVCVCVGIVGQAVLNLGIWGP